MTYQWCHFSLLIWCLWVIISVPFTNSFRINRPTGIGFHPVRRPTGIRPSGRFPEAPHAAPRAIYIRLGELNASDKDGDGDASSPSFTELGLDRHMLPAIQSKGWLQPTSIQKLAIPQLITSPMASVPASDQSANASASASASSSANASTSKAVWCEAPTGGGKTACYVLPLLQNLLSQQSTKRRQGSAYGTKGHVKSLILCPTRELAMQIGTVVHELASHVSSSTWRIVVVTGGVPREPQLQRLADCAAGSNDIDILIATPGRLVDVLQHYSSRRTTSSTGTTTGTGTSTGSMDGDDEASGSGNSRRKKSSTTKYTQTSRIETKVASEAALERRLLAALNARGKQTDQSLSLDQIQKLNLDYSDDEGRASLPSLLEYVPYLILDEADRLLSRTFETEMDSLLAMLPSKPNVLRHTWLFSATFPKHIEPRVDAVLNRRLGAVTGKNRSYMDTQTTIPVVRISCINSDRSLQANEETSSSLLKKLDRTTPEQERIEQVGPASTIGLRTIRLERRYRTQALRLLLAENPTWDRVLVFCSTRYAAEHVSRKLRRVGIESAELHGKLDQDARTRRLQDLTKGKIRVLLATDVASRGLDIVGLPAVVNYDLPRSPADFVHRIGRTGRAGLSGQAVTFVTPDSEAHLDLIEKRYLTEPLERETLAGFEPDEEQWRIEAQGSRLTVLGSTPSEKGLAHDRMFGGIKSRRKSKKDKVREAQAVQTGTSDI